MSETTGREGAQPTPVGELSYTQASRELDAIVEFFERREVDVDQLVARLERATSIVDELDRRIRQTRMQVEELAPRLEAAARAAVPIERAGEEGADEEEGDEADLIDEDELGDDEALEGLDDQASEPDRPLF
ncbi:MAG: exodeoxyribonuclease VII small subunit [Acidobacteriota bacterium]|nr:exodeoxyribonuclease VII small subunit [Acidobacteriota bacterium]